MFSYDYIMPDSGVLSWYWRFQADITHLSYGVILKKSFGLIGFV